MKTRTLPGGGAVETLAYNLTGTLANVTDFNGKITTFSYDAMNRLLARTPTGETAVSYTYTPTGQRQTMTDGSGSTSYAYDNQNRLVSKTASAGALSYTYDAAGDRLTAVSSNAGGTNVTFTYDALSRLQTVVDKGVGGSANPATYTYDAVGNLTSVALPNGVTVTPGYDTMYRVKSLAATSAPAAAYSYTYGPVGNRLSAQDGNGSAAYTYNSIYRLTEESIARGQTAGSLTYGLDPVGNRLSLASGITAITSQAFTYTANDRIMADSYDTNGNLLAAGGNTYAYDSQNRLTSFNAGAATFVYDGDGNRVAKTSGGVTTQYLVDDTNSTGLAQVAEEVVGGAVTRRYVYGLGRISQTQAAGTSYYGYDAHGDVRTLMNASGTVTDTYDYDAFGNLIASTGTTANVYRYQGEALDTETGLYYLRARYYDAVAGRFLTVDPLASEGNHPYTYASADPVNGHDPAGQQDVFEYKPLLVGPLTWPHFSLAMVTGGGGHGGGSPPGCLGGGGGAVKSFLQWIHVCQIGAPPMPSSPGVPYPSGPNKPTCNCVYHVRAHRLECRAYEWWGPVGDTFVTQNARAGNNDNPDYPTRQCVNNPDCEAIRRVGPLPATTYRMGDDKTVVSKTGQVTIRIPLTAVDASEMHRRDSMQIHQDWPGTPDRTVGTIYSPASEGCIASSDYERFRGFMRDQGCTRGGVSVLP
jgi:RHS repeat-associated protein